MKKTTDAQRVHTHAATIPHALQNFDHLPNSARVRLPVLTGIYGCSPATIWRRVKTGLIPAPHKEGGTTFWIVGELRMALAKEVA